MSQGSLISLKCCSICHPLAQITNEILSSRWLIALSINSWLICSQQLVNTAFRWSRSRISVDRQVVAVVPKCNSRPDWGLGCSVASSRARWTPARSRLGRQLSASTDVLVHHLVERWNGCPTVDECHVAGRCHQARSHSSKSCSL